MNALLFSLHAADQLKGSLLADAGIDEGVIEHRRFPDGESYVRFHTPVEGRTVVLLCSLDRPDERVVALLLAADAARKQGARQIGLIAPYLAYMRQDRAFHDGEAVSAQSFAAILSAHFDWLVTLEPHLHRIASLDEVYTIPARAAQATGPIGDWIAKTIECPFLVGPDSESAPWVERIARHVGSGFAVLDKLRMGDREVRITGTIDGLEPHMTPVVVDDIVSSGGTMHAILKAIAERSAKPSVYIAVHALCETMPDIGNEFGSPDRFVSCNSAAHPSNRIDIAAPLLAEVRELLASGRAEHAS